jgi:hypothetical protein
MATLPTTLPVLNSVVDQTRTKFANTFERPIAPGVAEVVDGMAMVGDYLDPIDEKATPCQGGGSEKFLGTAIVGVVNVRQLPLAEEFIAPTVAPPAVVTWPMQRTPKAPALGGFGVGTLVLYDLTVAPTVPLTQGVPGANSLYTIVGNVLSLGSGLMGHQLRAVYVYEPTFNEVLSRFHQASINFDNTNQLLEQVAIGGGIGSEIFTNFWNSDQGQFANGGAVALGANGRFAAGGAGNVVGVVIKAPTADDSTLGFRVTVEA